MQDGMVWHTRVYNVIGLALFGRNRIGRLFSTEANMERIAGTTMKVPTDSHVTLR